MDARKVNDGLIAAAGHWSRAYLREGFTEKDQIDQAEQECTWRDTCPTEPDVVLAAAEFALARRDFDRALSLLVGASAEPAKDWRVAGALAEVGNGRRRTRRPGSPRRTIDSLTDRSGAFSCFWALGRPARRRLKMG